MDKEMAITSDTVKVVPLKYFYFVLKRVMDVLISFVGILCLLPLILFVKVLYICSGDFHSIFYRQKRLGKHGKEIRIFKFRTMVVNAEEILVDWLKNNPEKRKEYLRDRKIEHDPRITKVGNFLRKTSLDEFPQFLNIFIDNYI